MNFQLPRDGLEFAWFTNSMNLIQLKEKLDKRDSLTRQEVGEAVEGLVSDGVSEAVKTAFLEQLALKGETAEEIAAFAMRLRDLAERVPLAGGITLTLDVCGTGADRSGTINVSSTVMFIAAAGGVRVAKHGNRSVSSQSGSADVLESLGVKIELRPDQAARCLEEIGMSFFFAPLYHPTYKKIAPIRKALADRGVRSVFNLLGPLINPCRPNFQLVGVFGVHLTEVYARVLQLMGLHGAMVAHGLVDGSISGLDELSISGPTVISSFREGSAVLTENVDARNYGIARQPVSSVQGGSAQENAFVLREILSNRLHDARCDLVLFNAAAALVVAGKCADLGEGLNQSREIIRSGLALKKLDQFIAMSRSFAG